MRLEFELVPNLPRLAWAASVRRGERTVSVRHGPWVETRDDRFFEGAWDAPFAEGNFETAFTFTGTGGRVAGDGILLAAPTHNLECLFWIRTGDAAFVSNSLAFLLALSGERLDPHYRHYYLDFLNSHRAGIAITHKRLRTAGPRFIELQECCNWTIRPDLTILREAKPLGPPPHDYASYASSLSRTTEQVFANANDAGRRWRYRPVTSLSQGYDTTAVSAIAARAGCCEAVTFAKSNSKAGYQNDSGVEIGSYLNLAVTEYERTDYNTLPERHEEEFYIEPHGVDRYLVLMEKQFEGALLLSGRFGERIWSREFRLPWAVRGDAGLPWYRLPTAFKIGGCVWGEFRLRTGFLHFPLAFSGALHAASIQRITDSGEMKPWSIGGGYDRPIPRRIAEESGVPRHLFGQVKKGGMGVRCHGQRAGLSLLFYNLWGLTYWPPFRIWVLRLTGNRLNRAWRKGSFGVQRGAAIMIERYRAAISGSSAALSSTAQGPGSGR